MRRSVSSGAIAPVEDQTPCTAMAPVLRSDPAAVSCARVARLSLPVATEEV